MTEAVQPVGTAPAGAGAADSAFAAYRATTHFASLDGLRCLCILAVLWHHGPVHGAMQDPAPILGRGFLGVDFFFVLSGFLITTLLLREEARDGRFSLRGFYWRRLLRIVPVYYFVVTLVSAYYVLIKGEGQFAQLLPFYYLFLSNFLTDHIPTLYPTWSLGVEEQYYVVWPLLLLLVPRRWGLALLGVLIAVNVAGIMGAFAPLGITAATAGPLRIALPNPTYAPILIGSAAAILLDTRQGFAGLHLILSRPPAPILAFAALVAVVLASPPDLRGLPNLAIHLAMAACLVSLVMREDNGLAPLLTLAPLARIGQVSYGIYLYHLITLDVAVRILGRLHAQAPFAVLVLYSLLAILVAEVSFRTLERYFRRFR